jgi:glycosyl transferase family 2
MSAPEIVFALAWGQNAFFEELARALAFELERLGAQARVVFGGMPDHRRGQVTVLLPPHEFVNLSGVRPPADLLARCVLISAEQPSSGFFAQNLALARDAGAVLDLNERAVRAYRGEGVEAERLQIGYSEFWDRRDAVPERDIDVLFLGRVTRRREEALAAYADVLERFRCEFVLSDDSTPNSGEGTNFVSGENKLLLLARSKVLLNIHGEAEPYFEWLRVAEAMSSGCVVVTEHSTDLEPLRAGTDIVTGSYWSLGLLSGWMADDAEARARVVAEADSRLRSHASLTTGAEALLQIAERVDRHPAKPWDSTRAGVVGARIALGPPARPDPPREADPLSVGEHRVLRALKRNHYELLSLRRQLAADALALGRPERPQPETVEVIATRGWREAPRAHVSVIVPLFNDGEVVRETLDSVVSSTMSSWELVVVDDASTDGGDQVVREWMEERPEARASIFRHEVNRGLSSARNTGAELARGDALLMLDSDNLLRPMGMARLFEALRADPGAAFAYGILDRFTNDGYADLVSKFGWEPERLRQANYIDALALIRRRVLFDFGGYSEDPRLALGLEDYDLWARLADAGQRGAFVRQFVGRYRSGHSSMLSVTSISSTDAMAAIAEHAPGLMRDVVAAP